MRVMVIVKATKEAEAADNPFDMEGAAEMFAAMGKYNEELVEGRDRARRGRAQAEQVREAGSLRWHKTVGD